MEIYANLFLLSPFPRKERVLILFLSWKTSELFLLMIIVALLCRYSVDVTSSFGKEKFDKLNSYLAIKGPIRWTSEVNLSEYLVQCDYGSWETCSAPERLYGRCHLLPALTKTSLETIVPIEFTAMHLYVAQCTSCRKLSPWKGGK